MYIFFDLDDTLLNKKKEITSFTKEILNKCRLLGHKLIINTARGYPATKAVIDELNPDYTIVNAGALILDKNLQVIYSNPIDKEIVKQVINEIIDYCDMILVQDKDILFTSNPNDKSETSVFVDFKNFDYNLLKEGAYKIVPKNMNINVGNKVKEKYDLDYCLYFSGVWSRFCNKDSTKLNGLKKVLEYDNIDISQSIAFGDDLGDLQMLLGSGVGVAMANSVKDVLENVSNITLSCEDDGVAVYLKKYFNLW